jgi:hypothetical protein
MSAEDGVTEVARGRFFGNPKEKEKEKEFREEKRKQRIQTRLPG